MAALGQRRRLLKCVASVSRLLPEADMLSCAQMVRRGIVPESACRTMYEEDYSAMGIQPPYHQLPWSADKKAFVEIKKPLP